MSGKVFLWSSPRTLSTAFTRAMLNLDNCQVFMEPYQRPYYIGPNRINERFADIPTNPNLTFQNATESICKDYDGKKHVFCKEMAYFFEGRLDELQNEKLKDFQHTFLIRHPNESIPSQYRVHFETCDPHWKTYGPNNGRGFRQLWELYEFAKKISGTRPLVILSDDLLKDPERVLKYFCDHTGLTYKEGMSRWEPGPVEGWGAGGAWGAAQFFIGVFNSSGIGRLAKPNDHVERDDYPDDVNKAIEDNVWFYEQLYEQRFRF